MTIGHLFNKSITFWMKNPNYQGNFYVKLTGAGLAGEHKKIRVSSW